MDTPFSYKLSDLQIPLKKQLKLSSNTKKPKQSVLWTVLTFLSTSFGIGFLSLPIAAAYTGVYFFVVLCLLVATMNYHSNFALVTIGKSIKAKNYPILVSKVLKNQTAKIIVHVVMLVNIIGTIITYTVGIQQSLAENMAYIGNIVNIHFPDYLGKVNSRVILCLLDCCC